MAPAATGRILGIGIFRAFVLGKRLRTHTLHVQHALRWLETRGDHDQAKILVTKCAGERSTQGRRHICDEW